MKQFCTFKLKHKNNGRQLGRTNTSQATKNMHCNNRIQFEKWQSNNAQATKIELKTQQTKQQWTTWNEFNPQKQARTGYNDRTYNFQQPQKHVKQSKHGSSEDELKTSWIHFCYIINNANNLHDYAQLAQNKKPKQFERHKTTKTIYTSWKTRTTRTIWKELKAM